MSPDSRPGAPNALRGLVIVVVAGLVGLFLLAHGGTSGLVGTTSKSGSTHATTTVPVVPTIPPESSTTAPPTTKPPAGVNVAVFNGTGGKLPNAAGNNKAKLTPLGYSQVAIYDTSPTAKSTVYYQDGFQGNAQAIAKALGIGPVASTTSAATLPPQATSANVVVIIGQDAPS